MTNKAVLIGNWTYHEDSGLRCLNGPERDLDLMKKAFTHDDFGLFDEQNVFSFADSKRDEICVGLQNVLKSTRREDYVVIYYSGHGVKIGKELCLAARETTKDNAVFNGVTASTIRQMLDFANRAERVVIILDCCYAGAFDKSADDAAVLDAALPGRWFLSSSPATETSKDGNDGEPSPFTDALVTTLLDPNLIPTRGHEITLDLVHQQIRDLLNPVPVMDQRSQGPAPLARRQPAKPTAQVVVDDLEELAALCETDVEIKQEVSVEPRQVTVLGHIGALLALATREAADRADSPYTRATIDAAWRFVSNSLRVVGGVDDDVLERIREIRNEMAGDCLTRVRLACSKRELAQLPWEHVRADEPSTDSLALARGVVVERHCDVLSRYTPPADPADPAALFVPAVALIGQHAGKVTMAAEEALRNDLATLGVDAKPAERGRWTWRHLISCNRPPTVLVLLAAMSRDPHGFGSGEIQVQIGGGSSPTEDWIEASRLVGALDELAPRSGHPAPYRMIVVEAFAVHPTDDAPAAAASLAFDLARLGLGHVVFLAHPAAFPGYAPADGLGQLRTFVGYLVSTLNQGQPVHRAFYLARRKMQQDFVQCERTFGIPGLYTCQFREPELGRLEGTGSGGMSRLGIPSGTAPRPGRPGTMDFAEHAPRGQGTPRTDRSYRSEAPLSQARVPIPPSKLYDD